jgi:cell division septation protein DedD
MPGRDGELFKDKIEVTLDGRQIFYLFFGGAVIACMVFVLGVMVGRRIEAREHAGGEAADPARDPLAALDQLEVQTSPELAFPAALRGDGANTPLGVVDATLAAAQAAKGELESEAKPDSKSPANAKQTVDAPAEAEAEPEVASASKPEPAKRKRAAEPAAEPATAQPEVIADDQPAARAAVPADVADSRARFTLQLSSFQERAEADAFFQELKTAGYSPYIVEADVADKGRWYRVRLGKYATHTDAVAAKNDFESRQRIIAYVTRMKSP